ncbi:MAG: hypothetical protein JRI95_03240 [Deltaproteobacteria bacterium]|nr:hypothetical protein [Deltaproteobacteria bacterium]
MTQFTANNMSLTPRAKLLTASTGVMGQDAAVILDAVKTGASTDYSVLQEYGKSCFSDFWTVCSTAATSQYKVVNLQEAGTIVFKNFSFPMMRSRSLVEWYKTETEVLEDWKQSCIYSISERFKQILAYLEPLGFIQFNLWGEYEAAIAESSTSVLVSVERELAIVKDLVEDGRVVDARHLLSSIQVPPGLSTKLDTWRKVLAEPRTKPREIATGGDLKKDALWLRKNASKYKGQWVALKDGALLGNDTSRVKLHHALKDEGCLNGALFVLIEE